MRQSPFLAHILCLQIILLKARRSEISSANITREHKTHVEMKSLYELTFAHFDSDQHNVKRNASLCYEVFQQAFAANPCRCINECRINKLHRQMLFYIKRRILVCKSLFQMDHSNLNIFKIIINVRSKVWTCCKLAASVNFYQFKSALKIEVKNLSCKK